MNDSSPYQRISELIARTTPPSGLMPGKHRSRPTAGEVWRTHVRAPFPADLPDECSCEEPYCVLVTGFVERLKGHDIFKVIPLHRDRSRAGPDDVIVDRHVFGHEMIACAGASLSCLGDSLDTCIGQVPSGVLEAIRSFAAWLDGSISERPEVATGIPYLGESDVRWVFKEALGESLAYLQHPVLAWAESCGLMDAAPGEIITEREAGRLSWLKELLLPSPIPELALAADDTIGAGRTLHSVVAASLDGRIKVCFSQAVEPGHLAVEVLEDPDQHLEGASIVDVGGQTLGKIHLGAAYILVTSEMDFHIQAQDGRQIVLSPWTDPDSSS